MAVYTDGIVLWSVGHSWPTRTVKARLQESLSIICHGFEDLGLSVFPIKRADMMYRLRGRLEPMKAPLYLNGERILRAGTHKYLGLTIDDRVTWSPAVVETLTLCRRLLSTLRKLCWSYGAWCKVLCCLSTDYWCCIGFYMPFPCFRSHYHNE